MRSIPFPTDANVEYIPAMPLSREELDAVVDTVMQSIYHISAGIREGLTDDGAVENLTILLSAHEKLTMVQSLKWFT